MDYHGYMLALSLVGTEKLQLGTLFWYLWCPLGEKGGEICKVVFGIRWVPDRGT